MIEKRSVVSVILLSIVTCGIYMVWWTYVTCCALQREGGKTSIPPVLTTLVMLFYSTIGAILLGIDADENVRSIKFSRGIPQTDNKVLWIVLGFFCPIATVGLVQHEINQIVDNSIPPYGNYPPNGGNYPPNGGNYPPNGGNYPPNGGNYPPNGGNYPPNGGNYPPNGGNYPPNGGNYPPN